MRCEQWRAILSAQLDGEETHDERAAAAAHLQACADCRRWEAMALEATRRAGIQTVTSPPGLTDALLTESSASTPRHGRPAALMRRAARPFLRVVLGVLGAAQIVLGLAQIFQGAGPLQEGSPHLWHESAAWNVGVGVGFVFVALRRTPPAGTVPVLSVFVAMLMLLSVNDLITGHVAAHRLLSHGFLLAGYVGTLLLSRSGRHLTGPLEPGQVGRRVQTRLDKHELPSTPLRLVPSPPGPSRVDGSDDPHARHPWRRGGQARRRKL
ncbi:zf-HC2 domain-containing protein [Micromonospora chalcea]|uniref:zf-HC2 domain-containing protein n=1 Tax=Micromonospora chalcea TaxID=1874 RepID=UPI0021A2656A|nr:zf-HC2 domain-containing protein [Micromonospora chalcea]MCT2281408.1 zf-HC2 domain-containing protein [Micromonospora chalcea]